MTTEEEYNPALCDHKHKNGFSSWAFQSEESANFPGSGRKVAVYVCYKCGEIRIAGRNDGNGFDEHFDIHHPEALAAIIKHANYLNERLLFVEAAKLSQAEEENKRFRKALDEINKVHEAENYGEAIWQMKSIATEALKQQP